MVPVAQIDVLFPVPATITLSLSQLSLVSQPRDFIQLDRVLFRILTCCCLLRPEWRDSRMTGRQGLRESADQQDRDNGQGSVLGPDSTLCFYRGRARGGKGNTAPPPPPQQGMC